MKAPSPAVSSLVLRFLYQGRSFRLELTHHVTQRFFQCLHLFLELHVWTQTKLNRFMWKGQHFNSNNNKVLISVWFNYCNSNFEMHRSARPNFIFTWHFSLNLLPVEYGHILARRKRTCNSLKTICTHLSNLFFLLFTLHYFLLHNHAVKFLNVEKQTYIIDWR